MPNTIQFFGGARHVTGANYLVSIGGKKILVDCGMFQGCHDCEGRNFNDFLYDPASIDALFLTHAHIDHSGRIPRLVKEGFRGTIISTPPTRDFAEVLLRDAMHIIEEERSASDRKKLLYTEKDLRRALALWKTVDFHAPISIGDVAIEMANAGHILGSAMVGFSWKEGKKQKRLWFTGDIGNPPSTFVPPPEQIAKTDFLVIEAAYGGRLHTDTEPRQRLLERAIEDVYERKGVLIIPAFAMERTQELLFELNELVEHHRVPSLPVFMDSPLAANVTGIFKKYRNQYHRRLHDAKDDEFDFPGLRFTPATVESKAINDVKAPKVIIAGSGMSNAGRILHHERRYLSDPASILLITGYQVAGSLGRRLLDGEKQVKIFGDLINVKCEVRQIQGYSAHADQRQLFNFIAGIEKPVERVFMVQGEESSALSLAQLVRDRLGIDAKAPMFQDTYGI
ncbi:MAG: MBL fold metallo-hydrolase [bacterium]|nr:MBL fold metallo-hydrolase [bacterium]